MENTVNDVPVLSDDAISSVIESHFEKILQNDTSAFEDYSQTIVSIVRAGGSPKTLNINGIKLLMNQLFRFISFDNAEVLVNRTTDTNGVLTVRSSFAPFLSYACIAKNGKITGATLYLYNPARSINLDAVPMPECKEANKMFWKHVRAMFSISAKVITKDYDENGVVITNMAKDVCNGKPQIYNFCDHLMKNCLTLLKKMDFHGISSVRWKICSAGDGLLLFTIEAPKMGMVMTESYYVKNGKIQFECSIADGAMLDLVHDLLDE